VGTHGARQHTPGDPVAVEFAKIMAVGGLIGVTASLVIATALARLAGLAWGTAFLTAAWPALVGGPFFGVAFGMVRRFARMDTMTSATPAAADPHPDALGAAQVTGEVAFGGRQA
jgi:hypothetical protein